MPARRCWFPDRMEGSTCSHTQSKISISYKLDINTTSSCASAKESNQIPPFKGTTSIEIVEGNPLLSCDANASHAMAACERNKRTVVKASHTVTRASSTQQSSSELINVISTQHLSRFTNLPSGRVSRGVGPMLSRSISNSGINAISRSQAENVLEMFGSKSSRALTRSFTMTEVSTRKEMDILSNFNNDGTVSESNSRLIPISSTVYHQPRSETVAVSAIENMYLEKSTKNVVGGKGVGLLNKVSPPDPFTLSKKPNVGIEPQSPMQSSNDHRENLNVGTTDDKPEKLPAKIYPTGNVLMRRHCRTISNQRPNSNYNRRAATHLNNHSEVSQTLLPKQRPRETLLRNQSQTLPVDYDKTQTKPFTSLENMPSKRPIHRAFPKETLVLGPLTISLPIQGGNVSSSAPTSIYCGPWDHSRNIANTRDFELPTTEAQILQDHTKYVKPWPPSACNHVTEPYLRYTARRKESKCIATMVTNKASCLRTSNVFGHGNRSLTDRIQKRVIKVHNQQEMRRKTQTTNSSVAVYNANKNYGKIYHIGSSERNSNHTSGSNGSWMWDSKYKNWQKGQLSEHFDYCAEGEISKAMAETEKPHADLYGRFNSESLQNQLKEMSAIQLQRHIRGWMERQRLQKLKQKLSESQMTWSVILGEYTDTTRQVRRRKKLLDDVPTKLNNLTEYCNKKEVYEGVFDKLSVDGGLNKRNLEWYLNECGLFPPEAEIQSAYEHSFQANTEASEVIFAIDCSKAVQPLDFRNHVEFVKEMASWLLHPGTDSTRGSVNRVGFVSYGESLDRCVSLQDMESCDDIKKEIGMSIRGSE